MSYNYYDPEDMTEQNLIKDKDFIEDARIILGERENFQPKNSIDTEEGKKEIYDRFMEHFRYQNVNEVTATRDLFYVQQADDVTKERFGRLMETFDKMDSDLGWDAAQDYLGGVFTAPSTYAGMFSFGASKAGALAAQQGVKLGIREVLKKGATESLKKQGIRATAKRVAQESAKKPTLGQRLGVAKEGFIQGGYRTALGAMAVDGAASGYTVYQQERIRDDVGIKDGISLENIALATTFSALGSGTIGAITGTSRTLSSNVAEQIRQVAIKKESVNIESAHKNFTQKIFRSAKTKKDAKEFKSIITNAVELVPEKGKRKLALKETVPEKLEEGKQLKEGIAGDIEFKQGRFDLSLEEKLHENIAAAAARIINLKGVDALPPPITKEVTTKKGGTAVATERFTSRLARGLANDNIKDDKIYEILNEHGISMQQLSSLLVEEYSRAASLIGGAGRLARLERKKLLAEVTELDQKLINLGDLVTPVQKAIREQNGGIGTKVANVYNNWLNLGALNKARIGFMTIQTATTARNTTNGYMRNYVYALDNLGEGLITTGIGLGKKVTGSIFNNNKLKDEANRAVAKGIAQLRTGGQSAYGKDLWLGTKSWETEALELLFRDERFSKSDLAKNLFKEMGDVGEITGAESGVVWIARKMNYLNTLSDNMFKRAVFSREIDKTMKEADIALLQKGGLKRSAALSFSNDEKVIAKIMGEGLNPVEASYYAKGLRDFFEEAYLDPINAQKSIGKFSLINDKAIGGAMEKAIDFTYQSGKFRERRGWMNTFFDGFIQFSSGILPSAAIPFPRYLVNQLIFQYEHMPILGMVNMGGILNKRGKAGEKSFIKLDPESFAKQATGLAMLSAFYGLRHEFGDEKTGPYDFKFQGKSYDLTASLGPFMGYAYLADWLYRHTGPDESSRKVAGITLPQIHDNNKVAVGIPGKTRDFINAFTGGLGRAGTGLYVVDSLVDNLLNINGEGASEQEFEEVTARISGDFFGTALVGGGVLKDIAGTVLDPNYRIVQDTNDVDMMEYMLKRATRPLPKKYDEEEDTPVYNPSRDRPLRNVNPFLKMLTGFTEEESKTIIQGELDRLRFDFREIAPKKFKGEGVWSNLSKGEMGRAMDKYILPYILSNDYQDLPSDGLKRKHLKDLINAYRGVSRMKVIKPSPKDTPLERNRKFRARFFDIPKTQRTLIERQYKNSPNYGNGTSMYDVTVGEGIEGDYLGALSLYQEMFGEKELFPTTAKAFQELN